MKKLHFYKAHCRLGLPHIPWGSDELNLGVEEGPDDVLSPEFLTSFQSKPSVDTYTFSLPEKINKTNYQEIIAREYSYFATLINQSIKTGESQVIVGGDHSVTFSSFLALSQRTDPTDISYLQVDSHADIHSFKTSHSGNFHGMYVRAFVDDVESPVVQNLVKKKLPAENVLYIGNHVNEQEEWDLLKEKKIRVISRTELLQSKKTIEEIAAFARSKKHLHISFDVDVFDKSIKPATGILVDDGFFPEDIFPVLEMLGFHPSISMDLVEVNPRKPGAKKTIELAQKLLQIVFQ